MKPNYNKIILAIASVISVFASKSVLGSENSSSAKSTSSKQTNLADQMIENEIFQIDPATKTVQVNESKLLQTLREELEQKLSDQSVHPGDKAIYQDLMSRLQPGSFARRNDGAQGLNSMDFGKAN